MQSNRTDSTDHGDSKRNNWIYCASINMYIDDYRVFINQLF